MDHLVQMRASLLLSFIGMTIFDRFKAKIIYFWFELCQTMLFFVIPAWCMKNETKKMLHSRVTMSVRKAAKFLCYAEIFRSLVDFCPSFLNTQLLDYFHLLKFIFFRFDNSSFALHSIFPF